ncbi:RNA-protein complex protein Nop10 [Methanobrevibacter sp.]|uniref:RNA-protein complex protein Nop10 n=2 Tax=Methanobrevibacter sp. TaxID=66852 RepID=UPI0025E1D52F|nr:RNA-protein complex protein Nop10 [Methanobrevibacter sp.]MEE0939074.1 RNA-protein complex protein Nop10 [Methanobrevibacter sp.]
MNMKMNKCPECGIYTLKDACPKCGGQLKVIYPPKFSIEDKYGKYRRILKKESMKEQ